MYRRILISILRDPPIKEPIHFVYLYQASLTTQHIIHGTHVNILWDINIPWAINLGNELIITWNRVVHALLFQSLYR